MKFAPVMPAELYPIYSRGDYHMIQAHMVASNRRVQRWMRDRAYDGDTVILDNGVIELGEANVDDLFSVARRVRPTIVVCPDVFCNKQRTMLMVYKYSYECVRYAKFVMLVPHGHDLKEWRQCIGDMLTGHVVSYLNPARVVVGVPKVLDSFEKHGRYKAVEHLVDDLKWPQERIHLLGVWSGIDQLFRIRNDFPEIAGVDTTLPVALALNHEKMLGAHAPKRKITDDQWGMTLDQVDPAMNDALKHNIELVRQIVSESRMEEAPNE